MEEDIKILEKYTEKDIPCDSCRYCGERPNVTKAVRNLIAKYKELEKKYTVVKTLNETQEYKLELYYIPKSKVKEKLEKYKLFEWNNIDDKYCANRIIAGIDELLED